MGRGIAVAARSKKEIKEQAQDNLIQGMQATLTNCREGVYGFDDDHESLIEEMERQFERVEALFGYAKGANPKGC